MDNIWDPKDSFKVLQALIKKPSLHHESGVVTFSMKGWEPIQAIVSFWNTIYYMCS